MDVPCSGLGVLRRKPDSRWRKTQQLLKELPELQLEILKSGAACVKPGGILVYSTCTIAREENHAVVENSLRIMQNFSWSIQAAVCLFQERMQWCSFIPSGMAQMDFLLPA